MSTPNPSSERLHSRIDDLAERTEGALQRGLHHTQAAAHRAVEHSTSQVTRIQRGVRSTGEHLTQHVHQRPLKTLAWAAGLGTLAGLLLGRARRRSRSS